jgi:phage shock protein PspC (stress-responsive transcriptional regulator)
MKLHRSHDDHQIAGVCGGLAEHLGWDSGKLRVVWVLATIFTAFAGVVVYFALWYLMPDELPPAPTFKSPLVQPWKNVI